MAPPTGCTHNDTALPKLLKEIETKLQLSQFKQGKGKDIVEKGNTTTLERHVDALAALVREVDKLKVKIEGKKLEEGDSMDEVGGWSSTIDAKVEDVDNELELLRKCLSEVRQQSQLAKKEKEDELLAKERENQLQFEKEKLEMKLDYEKKSEVRVRENIVNCKPYVNNIMGLPTIMGKNPIEVEGFYKRLLYNVQSLETLGRLCTVAENVRAVLDKLKGIKSDLVRDHEWWQKWDFRQLLQAIKSCKDINPITRVSYYTKLPHNLFLILVEKYK